MGEDLFGDLPPPSYHPSDGDGEEKETKRSSLNNVQEKQSTAPPPLPPALKSALKRPKSGPAEETTGKKLRFKMTTDASEAQVIDAMQKIASHIKNPSKFCKASKLAIQLVEAKSVTPSNSDHFFAILEAAMGSNTKSCHDASVRTDYHALFSAANDSIQFFNRRQTSQVIAWTIRAVVGNDLYTDDSFVFSKAANRVKDLISELPHATKEDDIEEAAALGDEPTVANANAQLNHENVITSSVPSSEEGTTTIGEEESDPFGLDFLISDKRKKDDSAKGKGIIFRNKKDEQEEETKKFLKLKREALINCLEIAAKCYKIPWCQTVIDILVKHAFDNILRFTAQQREAIDKLWASIREQHIRRKQGKSVSGKLDVNGFEWLQQKYAGEKISIRRSVGGSGDRRCTQWLG